MTMTDPIADLLTRIRNALISKHDRLEVPASKQKVALCKVLEEQGYIRGFRLEDDPPGKSIEILLRYATVGEAAGDVAGESDVCFDQSVSVPSSA